jgi:predicted transposase YbfD/YdcC
MALRQLKVADHSNETAALLELLRALELAGYAVRAAVIGCRKQVAKESHEADAQSVLALKVNQGTFGIRRSKRYLPRGSRDTSGGGP